MLNECLLNEFETALNLADSIFSAVKPEAYGERPIPLRHPNLFYFGHLPAFACNQILRAALGEPSFNDHFDNLFERGIDPPDDALPTAVPTLEHWPPIKEINAYRLQIENRLFELLQ